MNLVKIDTKSKTYSVYEGKKLLTSFKSDYALYPEEVEALRQDPDKFFAESEAQEEQQVSE